MQPAAYLKLATGSPIIEMGQSWLPWPQELHLVLATPIFLRNDKTIGRFKDHGLILSFP